MFAAVSVASGYVLSNYCSDTFLLVAGLVEGPVGEGRVAACAGVTGLWAILTFVAGAAGTGGWTYNSGSTTANARRQDLNTTVTLNGTSYNMHRDQFVFDEFDSLIRMHSPQHGHKINHVAKLNNYTSHIDMPSVYSFSTRFSFGNVSVIGDAKSVVDALKVHESCQMGNNCISDSSNTTSKRDNDDSGWVSYTDWGTNPGYDQDYEDWNYGYLVPHDYAEKLGGQLVEKTQSCTNDIRCFAVANKYCLSLGYSQERTQDSVAVGEVYMNAYGGVDGDCMNG